MITTKDMLLRSLTLLQSLCPDEDFDIEWAMGQPKLVKKNQSIDISLRGTKAEVHQYLRMVIIGVETARRK